MRGVSQVMASLLLIAVAAALLVVAYEVMVGFVSTADIKGADISVSATGRLYAGNYPLVLLSINVLCSGECSKYSLTSVSVRLTTEYGDATTTTTTTIQPALTLKNGINKVGVRIYLNSQADYKYAVITLAFSDGRRIVHKSTTVKLT